MGLNWWPLRPSCAAPTNRRQRPTRAHERQRIALAFVFAFAVLTLIAALHRWLDSIVVVGSLAGSVGVAFGKPQSDMARPRSLPGGQSVPRFHGSPVSYLFRGTCVA